MKKIIIISILCFFTIKSVYCQTDLVSKIVYNQSFKYGNREFKGVLLANKNETIYFYGRTDDGNEKKELIEKSELEYQINLRDKEGWTTYINKDKNLIVTRDNIFTNNSVLNE
ncbi:MAG: hypothetical protein IE931_15060 [Sphingobacteriales bacterium]|nr:hypothetical protein [Sphingobacteriales bacterium]